jgi:hypothetical protein
LRRGRILKLHWQLWTLEHELELRSDGEELDDLIERLDGLEEKANRLWVPLHYSNLMHSWRIHLVTSQLLCLNTKALTVEIHS